MTIHELSQEVLTGVVEALLDVGAIELPDRPMAAWAELERRQRAPGALSWCTCEDCTASRPHPDDPF